MLHGLCVRHLSPCCTLFPLCGKDGRHRPGCGLFRIVGTGASSQAGRDWWPSFQRRTAEVVACSSGCIPAHRRRYCDEQRDQPYPASYRKSGRRMTIISTKSPCRNAGVAGTASTTQAAAYWRATTASKPGAALRPERRAGSSTIGCLKLRRIRRPCRRGRTTVAPRCPPIRSLAGFDRRSSCAPPPLGMAPLRACFVRP